MSKLPKIQEIQKQEKEISVIQEDVLIDYLKSLGLNVNNENAVKFINIAKAFGLNPFKREIYAIPFKTDGKEFWNIIVGYEVYIKRAERSRKLAGWKVWTEGSLSKGDLKACIQIKRKDWEEPFYHEVWFVEYNQNNKMWKSKPITMIKKVAIAQGFRLAFPEEIGGMPYTIDEIDMTNSEKVIDNEEQPIIGDSINPASGEVFEDASLNDIQKKYTIEKIKEIIIPELKEIFSKRQMKTKEIEEFFEKYNGDQKAILKALNPDEPEPQKEDDNPFF